MPFQVGSFAIDKGDTKYPANVVNNNARTERNMNTKSIDESCDITHTAKTAEVLIRL